MRSRDYSSSDAAYFATIKVNCCVDCGWKIAKDQCLYWYCSVVQCIMHTCTSSGTLLWLSILLGDNRRVMVCWSVGTVFYFYFYFFSQDREIIVIGPAEWLCVVCPLCYQLSPVRKTPQDKVLSLILNSSATLNLSTNNLSYSLYHLCLYITNRNAEIRKNSLNLWFLFLNLIF